MQKTCCMPLRKAVPCEVANKSAAHWSLAVSACGVRPLRAVPRLALTEDPSNKARRISDRISRYVSATRGGPWTRLSSAIAWLIS